MSTADRNLENLLATVADGRLDELSPDQVAALEEYLDASPDAAARLAAASPNPDPRLSPAAASPTTAEWDAVWDNVESASSTPNAQSGLQRLIRFWRPLSAAAACALLMLMWRGIPRSDDAAWPIQLSDQVVVHEIEVFGDADAFVDYGDGGGGAMIWLLEDEGV